MSERVAILGATGFVGSALTEYLLDKTDLTPIPFAHGTGSATRLAHRRLEMPRIDLLDRQGVHAALRGIEYVVNCSRGGKQLMLDGLDNLVSASRNARVKKFVHLSSVAVYGDPPHPASTSESAPAEPAPESYGAMKLLQDERVQRAASKGLPTVILCPPNITGPYSEYLLDIINSAESGRFRLLDGGNRQINIVDVNNLSACIVAALRSEISDGRRMFACEPANVTWRDLCAELQPVMRGDGAIASMSADEFAAGLPGTSSQSASAFRMRGMLRHLVSSDVREALRGHPAWAAIEGTAKAGVRSLGKRTENYLRQAFDGPIKVPQARIEEAIDYNLVAQQLRGVKHDPSRSHQELGFQPPLSFSESMESFRRWYKTHLDVGSAEWELLGRAVSGW